MNNKHTLVLYQQVRDYISALPPDTKKAFNRELSKLSKGGGDTHPLKDALEGYHRLRIGRHRVIYMHAPGPAIECAYAGPRATIYTTFVPAQNSHPAASASEL